MSFSDTITWEDIQRSKGPLSFNLMAKPVGSLCNLDCDYCYYLDKAEIYGGKEPVMSIDILEKFTRSYIEANETPQLCFNWHGGEPLIAGLDFFRKAIEFQKKYGSGREILNTIQTNGTLVNDEWAKLFADNAFLVGVSIDGPEDVHDKFRKDKGGKGTFAKVIRGIETMYRNKVEYNLMATINKASEGRGAEIYSFLKRLGTRFIQFNPVVEHVIYRQENARPAIVDPDYEGSELAPWSVSDIAFGQFLIDVFDSWYPGDRGRYFVNYFDNTLANWCKCPSGTCSFSDVCGGNAVIEHNGDIYPCDHFVYPQYKLGNIFSENIHSIMSSQKQISFGLAKRMGLPSKCEKCRWWFACHGECPKHRFNKTEKSEKGLNALCEGYKMFFEHVAPAMDNMRNDLFKTIQ